jgi:hypothetical protein
MRDIVVWTATSCLPSRDKPEAPDRNYIPAFGRSLFVYPYCLTLSVRSPIPEPAPLVSNRAA